MQRAEWRCLPNAKHITRLIESLQTYPAIWCSLQLEKTDVLGLARKTAWDAAYNAKRIVEWHDVHTAMWCATPLAPRPNPAAWTAATALIAWDDCAHFLDMSGEHLATWAQVSNNAAAFLLLAANKTFSLIHAT